MDKHFDGLSRCSQQGFERCMEMLDRVAYATAGRFSQSRAWTKIVFALAAFFASPFSMRVYSEVVSLKNGHAITGTWLNKEDKQATVMQVRTPEGIEVELQRSDVKSILAPTPPAEKYAANAMKQEDDSASHRKIIDWSVRQGLTAVADAHRERLVELDQGDKSAWSALGYVETPDGWIRKDVYWRRKGMQQKNGKWRIPQDVAIEEMESVAKIHEAEINKKIDQSIRDLRANNSKAATARSFLDQLDDPAAVPKLMALLEADRDAQSQFRIDITNILGRIKHPSATNVLVHRVLHDPDSTIVDLSIDYLMEYGTELAMQNLRGRLRNDNPSNDDPAIYRRAASALARIGDHRCIPELIRCLVTKHLRKPPPQPQMQAGVTNDGGTNFAPSPNNKPVETMVTNPEVLSALQTITGENGFQFDEDAWKKWYASAFASRRSDIFRDP